VLELKSRHALSNQYVATKSGTEIAWLRRSTWRGHAEIQIRGRTLNARARGVMKRRYVLSEGGKPFLELTQPSGWRNRVVFRLDGRDYEILNRPWYRSNQLLRWEGSDLGSIRLRGLLATRVEIDLPDSLPEEIQVFLGWFALMRRDEAAAASAA
jgi:hypothetical protein